MVFEDSLGSMASYSARLAVTDGYALIEEEGLRGFQRTVDSKEAMDLWGAGENRVNAPGEEV